MRILFWAAVILLSRFDHFSCCCIPSPCPVSATTAVLLLYCFTLPYLCKHSCVSDGCFTYVCVCVLALKLFPPSSAWPLSGKEWELGKILNLVIPALEEPLFPCPASCWCSWAPAVPLGDREAQIQQRFCLLPCSRLLSETASVGPHCWVGNGE